MTRVEVLAELDRRIAALPMGFEDDGCSAPPLLRVLLAFLWRRIRRACRAHDAAYCQRVWPAGALDQAHRYEADAFLGRSARALLPFGMRWIGWGIHLAVDRWGGNRAYDSCGPEAGSRCRHGMPLPAWMVA